MKWGLLISNPYKFLRFTKINENIMPKGKAEKICF